MSKEKIMNATVKLIKTVGIDGVSVRKIAEIADVNVASINYYFGSKDKLINEILKISLTEFRGAFNILDETDLSPMAKLKKFLLAYASLLQVHPELAKIILSQEKLFDSHAEYIEFMKSQGLDKLIKNILEIIGDSNKDKIYFIIRQMFASIFFPIVISGSVNPKIRETMEENIFLNDSIEMNIDLFLDLYFHKFLENSTKQTL